jgi:hypothetical protein
MKTNVTLFFKIFFLLCILSGIHSFAQSDYSFKNPTLISGTALQQGAVYKYSNVKTGVDAIMTLGFISPGVVVAELDGKSGYPEAIQPTLNLTTWTSGYLEMDIQFVDAGTTTPVVQSQIAVTCIDVDGIANYDSLGNSVHEFDEVNIGGGYADYSNSILALKIPKPKVSQVKTPVRSSFKVYPSLINNSAKI